MAELKGGFHSVLKKAKHLDVICSSIYDIIVNCIDTNGLRRHHGGHVAEVVAGK